MTLINAYCTVAEVRSQLADTGSKIEVALIEKAINASSRAIDTLCGRRFWRDATVTSRTYRPTDAYEVRVDDISTSTGLIVKTDTTGDGTWATTWDAADYQLEPLNSDVVAGGDTLSAFAWWKLVAIDDKVFLTGTRRASLQVTARFGWSAVPDDVNTAAILKSVGLFKRKDAPFGIAGFGDFAMRISRRDSDVWELLNPYIRIRAGV